MWLMFAFKATKTSGEDTCHVYVLNADIKCVACNVMGEHEP